MSDPPSPAAGSACPSKADLLVDAERALSSPPREPSQQPTTDSNPHSSSPISQHSSRQPPDQTPTLPHSQSHAFPTFGHAGYSRPGLWYNQPIQRDPLNLPPTTSPLTRFPQQEQTVAQSVYQLSHDVGQSHEGAQAQPGGVASSAGQQQPQHFFYYNPLPHEQLPHHPEVFHGQYTWINPHLAPGHVYHAQQSEHTSPVSPQSAASHYQQHYSPYSGYHIQASAGPVEGISYPAATRPESYARSPVEPSAVEYRAPTTLHPLLQQPQPRPAASAAQNLESQIDHKRKLSAEDLSVSEPPTFSSPTKREPAERAPVSAPTSHAEPSPKKAKVEKADSYYNLPTRPGVTPFILKLRFMLDAPGEFRDAVVWDKSGKVVLTRLNSGPLGTVFLPRLFGHSSTEAFGRQFGTYNFSRVAKSALIGLVADGEDVEEWKGWQHERFQRNSTDQTLLTLGPKKGSGNKRAEGTVPKVGKAASRAHLARGEASRMIEPANLKLPTIATVAKEEAHITPSPPAPQEQSSVAFEGSGEEFEDTGEVVGAMWDYGLAGSSAGVGYATQLASEHWGVERRDE